MRPRNKYEKTILAKSKKLHPITEAQKEWAEKSIPHYAYRLPKGRTTCMDCGHSWLIEEHTETCTCPHCGAVLEVMETRKTKLEQEQYFTILTTMEGLQVLRVYVLYASGKKGKEKKTIIHEVAQYWWNAEGQMTLIARKSTLFNWNACFELSSPLEIRRDSQVYQSVADAPTYPRAKFSNILRRNGLTKVPTDISPHLLITSLFTDSRIETLLKSGEIDHLRFFLYNNQHLPLCWDSYKIALRHGYSIEDISLWCDLVRALKQLGKDTHSTKYICPTDLKAEHDKWIEKATRARDRKREERDRQRVEKEEEEFKRLKGKFFGVNFSDGTINIHVLESVEEYKEEGKAMHHCVFDSGYDLKENSLILSARLGEKRIETVEISITPFEVLQSRGVCNKTTEYHDQIVELVKANSRLILQRDIKSA